MKYSKKQYAGMAEALRQAKPYLLTGKEMRWQWRGKTPFICFALMAAHAGDVCYAHADRTECEISRRLDYHATVAHWLFDRGIIEAMFPYTSDLQDYRHRWVDALIAEFEEKAR